MINLEINSHILERHRTFLINSPLFQNIQKCLENTSLTTVKKDFGEEIVKPHYEFFQCLKREYQNLLKKDNDNIFVGTPAYLHSFIQNVKQEHKKVQQKIETDPKYSNYIYTIFGYDQFVNSHNLINNIKSAEENIKDITLENFDNIEEKFKWSAYAYVLSLKIKVCPYCNRNYILPLYSENGKMRADLDHFFAKNKYPYLSISIYNLVPSCKYCNSSLKGKQEFTYEGNFHPFDKISADKLYRITYVPKSTDCFLGKEDFDIELEYNQEEKDWKKMKSNHDVFKIKETYQYHRDIVAGFIKKRYIYDDGYIEYLLKTYPNLFSSREEVVSFLLSPHNISQAENAPLGKLMKDLMEEMDF